MMSKFRILCFLLIAFGVTACEKAAMPRDDGSAPRELFEQLWRGIDQTYSLFEYTDVDWDEVRTRYSKKVHDDMQPEELYSVMSDMLEELKDGHTTLYPGMDDMPRRSYNFTQGYLHNYMRNIVEKQYLFPNDMVEVHANFRYCIFRDFNIGYVCFDGYFSDNMTMADFAAMLDYFTDTYGLILDIRCNGGGEVGIMTNMLSHFTDRDLHVGSIKYKTGRGRRDFSDWIDIIHTPNMPYYSKPVMLLVNRSVYSAANDMAQFALSYPNITVVGARTGGGIGMPVTHFLTNGWYYRTSASVARLPDGTVHIDGIQPDVSASADYEDMRDGIIDRAVELILQSRR